jgi:hypothetical protein
MKQRKDGELRRSMSDEKKAREGGYGKIQRKE